MMMMMFMGRVCVDPDLVSDRIGIRLDVIFPSQYLYTQNSCFFFESWVGRK